RNDLRTSTRRLVQLMVEDHLNALKANLGRLETVVRPILVVMEKDLQWENPKTGGLARVAAESEHWSEVALRPCADVEETMNLTLGMFVETNRPVTQREAALRQLLSGFADLDGSV